MKNLPTLVRWSTTGPASRLVAGLAGDVLQVHQALLIDQERHQRPARGPS
ncbi:hypothetical protein ACRCRM_31400 [Pseudomonas aeruginosa]